MTVKKVDPSQELKADVISLLKNNQAAKVKRGSVERTEEELQALGESRVDISLAKAINSELNADQIAAERRAKIEKLKAQTSAGEYNPPLEDVARSMTEELAFEILSTPHDALSFFEGEE